MRSVRKSDCRRLVPRLRLALAPLLILLIMVPVRDLAGDEEEENSTRVKPLHQHPLRGACDPLPPHGVS